MSTGIPEDHLDMAVDGRTRSQHFASKSADNPFLAIMITPRIFPQKILEAKVYKTTSTSRITVVIIKYKKGQEILTESFCSPIFGTTGPSKKNACRAACDYITRNFMDKLKKLDDDTLSLNNGPDGDQHDDKDHDGNNMVDLPHVEGVPNTAVLAVQ